MRKLLNGITATNAALSSSTGLVFILVVLITVYDIVMRYFFNAPTIWALEISLLLCGCQLVFAGVGISARDEHIGIDLVLRRMPPCMVALLKRLYSALTAVYLGALTYYTFPFFLDAWNSGETSASTLNSPAPTIVKFFILLSFFLMSVQSVINIFKQYKA